MSETTKVDSVRARAAGLGSAQGSVLALASALQATPVAMLYLERRGRLKTFYEIHEGIDHLKRVVRGRKGVDVAVLESSIALAGRQIDELEASADEPADVAADAIDVMVQTMRHFLDPAVAPAVDVALSVCDLASRLAEEVVEASGDAERSPFVEGDAAADRSLDSTLEVLRNIEELTPDELQQQATRILSLSGAVGLEHRELLNALIRAHGDDDS